jgi:hypothetical protein
MPYRPAFRPVPNLVLFGYRPANGVATGGRQIGERPQAANVMMLQSGDNAMTVSTMELKVRAIRDDDTATRAEKIKRLTKLRDDARALQRAATESPMVDDDGWYEDVHVVDLALSSLGLDVEEKGPATL